MKLNRKGYMLVEIIVAATIAFSIAYYLLNLTYKFKSKSEDLYNQTPITADKINITKNIMNDLDGKNIKTIETINFDDNYNIWIKLENHNNIEGRLLIIQKNYIEYCTTTKEGVAYNNCSITNDKVYYKKNLDKNINISNPVIDTEKPKTTSDFGLPYSINNSYVVIKLPLVDSYGNKQEEIKLIIG